MLVWPPVALTCASSSCTVVHLRGDCAGLHGHPSSPQWGPHLPLGCSLSPAVLPSLPSSLPPFSPPSTAESATCFVRARSWAAGTPFTQTVGSFRRVLEFLQPGHSESSHAQPVLQVVDPGVAVRTNQGANKKMFSLGVRRGLGTYRRWCCIIAISMRTGAFGHCRARQFVTA